jgi:ribosomal RNA-processing protein 12
LSPLRLLVEEARANNFRQAFDQSWAEQLANVLYKQVDLRADVCRALQSLVDSNKDLLSLDAEAEVLSGVTKSDAQQNLSHLATFANNLLAVLFNVYTETLPQYRGFILTCIDRYLSITSKEVRLFSGPPLSCCLY